MKPHQYDAADPTCSLYVLTTRDGEGPLYIKVGISKTPESRAVSVRTGCPIPIIGMRAIECPSVEIAKALEKATHEVLKAHGTSGEWFRFGTPADSKLAWGAILKLLEGRNWPIRDVDVARGYQVIEQRTRERMDQKRAAQLARLKKEVVTKGFSLKGRFD